MRTILFMLTCAAIAAQGVTFEPVAATPTTRMMRLKVQIEDPGTDLSVADQAAVDRYLDQHPGLSKVNREFLAYAIPLLINSHQLDARDNDGTIILDQDTVHYFRMGQPYIEGFLKANMWVNMPVPQELPPLDATPPCFNTAPLQLGGVPVIPSVSPTGGAPLQPVYIDLRNPCIDTGTCRLECWVPQQPTCQPREQRCWPGVNNPGTPLASMSGSRYTYSTTVGWWLSPASAAPQPTPKPSPYCPPIHGGPPQPPPPPVFPGNCAPLVPGAPGTVTTGGVTNPVQPPPSAAGGPR